MTTNPLSEEELDTLASFLESDAVPTGSLDYIATHGFITASAVLHDDWQEENLAVIINGELDQNIDNIQELLNKQFQSIHRQLYLGDDYEMPTPAEPAPPGDTNELTDWCFGFMESVAVNEDRWFIDPEQADAVADLLLPISILSEPHVEPELIHLVKTEAQRQDLANEIPDCIQQLYLLFRD